MLQAISIRRVSMFQRPLIMIMCYTLKSIQSIAHHVYQLKKMVCSWVTLILSP